MQRVMRLVMRPLAAAMAIGAWLLLSIPAATAQAQMPSPGLSDPSPDIPEQKLDAAAAALQQRASLKGEYEQRIAAAPSSDKERIADEANNALVAAITDHGLSVDEYTSILVVAQKDPGIRQKILQRIRPSKE